MSIIKAIFDSLKVLFPEKAEAIDKIEIPKDEPAGGNPAPAPAPDKNTPPGNPAPTGIAPEVAAELAAMRAELQKEKEENRKYKEIVDQSAGAMAKEKVDAALQKAIAEGRLPADNKELQEKWRAGLAKDFTAQIDLLNSLPPLPKNPAPATGGTEDKGGSGAVAARTSIGSGVTPAVLKYAAAQSAAHGK